MLKRLKTSALAIAIVINVAVIALMAASGYAGHLSAAVHPRWAVLTLTFPFFLAADALCLLFWLCVRWRWAWLPIVGMLACAEPAWRYLPVHLGGGSDTADAVKVLSYNVGGLSEGGNMSVSEEEVLDYLRESDADIICLQETAGDKIGQLSGYHSVSHMSNGGDFVTLLSRVPILRAQKIDYDSRGNVSAAYWLRLKGRDVVVVNNHLETNRLSLNDRANFKDIIEGDVSARAARGESRQLLSKVARAARLRAPQAEAVSRFAREQRDSGRTVIVCGDFNDTPLSYTVRTIGDGLTDCYASSGLGPGWSYRKNAMHVRIDHIFCSDEWEPTGAKVDTKITASDHYPIYCWLKKRLKR